MAPVQSWTALPAGARPEAPHLSCRNLRVADFAAENTTIPAARGVYRIGRPPGMCEDAQAVHCYAPYCSTRRAAGFAAFAAQTAVCPAVRPAGASTSTSRPSYTGHCLEMKTRLTGVSFALALAAAIFLLVWPVYSGFNGSRPTHATLLEVNGPSVFIPVMFPVFTALIAWLVRRQWARIVATILISGFVLIAGFTIGLFYLPSAILMLLASCVADAAKPRDVVS